MGGDKRIHVVTPLRELGGGTLGKCMLVNVLVYGACIYCVRNLLPALSWHFLKELLIMDPHTKDFRYDAEFLVFLLLGFHNLIHHPGFDCCITLYLNTTPRLPRFADVFRKCTELVRFSFGGSPTTPNSSFCLIVIRSSVLISPCSSA